MIKSSPKQTGDLFVRVMEPFIAQVRPAVANLKVSGQALDNELKSVMAYYGESVEGSDAAKPEDVFGMIMTFSSALQKAAVEMHDAEAKAAAAAATPASPTILVPVPVLSPVLVPPTPTTELEEQQHDNALKGQGRGRSPARPEINGVASSQSLQPSGTQDRISGRSTVGRGDLDQAIRSIRDGQRRARPSRPLSRMFLDGANDQVDRRASRAYDFPTS